MAWFLYVLAALAFPVALAAAAGAALPAAHISTRRARFNRSAAELFALISGPPDWRPEVTKYEELPAVNGKRRWRETSRRGGAILYELLEAVPPRRLVTRIADDSLPFGGTWTFELTADSNATELRITENGVIPNVIFRFLARYAFGHAASIQAYLKALATKCGEESRIED